MTNTLSSPIGILGGTFDPVHWGHIGIALDVAKRLNLSVVKFIPCYLPVHRALPSASSQNRVEMVRLGIADYPHLTVDEREIQRKTPSYMIDTLRSLRQDYPNAPLCLILGSDAYRYVPSWKDWQQLLNYAHFVVVNRAGVPLTSHAHSWLAEREMPDEAAITNELAGHILLLNITPYDVCATTIRHRLTLRQDVSDFLPASVIDYIHHHNLYTL